jgi:PKD repeat protein
VAHFRITSPIGWFENLGNDYNPSWLTNTPTRRGLLQRPYATPQRVGDAPATATFNAAASISGINGSLGNAGITNYLWNFGDGTVVSATAPVLTHTFRKRGDWLVQLTVQNEVGESHTSANVFRVSDPGAVFPTGRPSPPPGLRVVH